MLSLIKDFNFLHSKVTVLSKTFFLMAKIFSSYFMQAEFQHLYQVLLPSLNQCGACGVTKCFFCVKFDISCAFCKFRRCIACVKFYNTLNLFFKNNTRDQWNYICNFLHDIFRLHWKARCFYPDKIFC